MRACVRPASRAPRARLGGWAASQFEERAFLSVPDPPHRPGGKGTTGFEGGATPIANCGGYGAGCPGPAAGAIMVNGGMAQAFM